MIRYSAGRMAAIDVYRALWRRRYLIIVLTAVITGIAWYLASKQTKMYRATTLVRIQQSITDPTQAYGALAVGEQLAQTYAQIVTAQSIQQRIYNELTGKVGRSDVNISASPVQNLALLHISDTSSDPNRAALVANQAPVALRRSIAGTQSNIKDQIVTINRADVPTAPVSPHPKQTALLALLVGLVFNGGLALVIEFLSDRLPDVEEIEKTVGKPVLGTIPALRFASAKVEPLDPDRTGWLTQQIPAAPPDELGVVREARQEGGIG